MSDLVPSSFPRRPRYRFAGCGARFMQRAAIARISMINLLWVLSLVLYGCLRPRRRSASR